MTWKPQKFFIGLMDFFSVLLLGALLTYLLMGKVGTVVPGHRYDKLDSAQAWAALLFSTYLLGHLVFLLDSCGWTSPVNRRDALMRSALRTRATTGSLPGRWIPARCKRCYGNRRLS